MLGTQPEIESPSVAGTPFSEFFVEATKDLFARAKEAQILGISGSSLR